MSGAPVLTQHRPLQAFGIVQDGAVHLFACDIDSDATLGLAESLPLLSPAERARAQRFHFPRDRDRFVRGRAFARRVLGQHKGTPPQTLRFAYGAQGKPALHGHGPWFNLSHSGGMAVLALSDTGPVGVDIEVATRAIDVLGLGQTCFDAAENAVLRALPAADRMRHFLAFWMAKEARMKLTGEGMSLEPRAISLDLRQGWPVGYLRPDAPRARLDFVELPDTELCCCVATLAVRN